MIELVGLNKTFHTAAGEVAALKDVSLKVDKGDIYGVVGFSGAGKSTLIRCVNLLEKPDSGSVKIDGREITAYGEKQLAKEREGIGMIFQHFNLLRNKTVFENVAFPLRYARKNRREIEKRVGELLELVDLSDKTSAYPSQLSGGQKQRVAIARALAMDPKILLSDEATSALDPQTTESILQLLKKLNEQLGLTILLITHEMDVVRRVCNKVAVMEKGSIVESGDTFRLFTQPQSDITRRFVDSLLRSEAVGEVLYESNGAPRFQQGRLFHLLFVGDRATDPHIARAIRDYRTDISIIFGNIEMVQGKPIGSLYVLIDGQEADIDGAIEYFRKEGIRATEIDTRGGDDL
ncbi:MAG: ATP-binding cassette domain-containing protein [Clostridia bacterium]|nr:ATP-binding cassette domain-containing protein [Clostridia bacterium]